MFEKVNPSHPDKIADRIAGAIVDLAYKQQKNPRIAVEVLIGHRVCTIIAETSVLIPEQDVIRAVRRIAGDVHVNIRQVPQDAMLADNQSRGLRCGDNGIFKGVPVTTEQKALCKIARRLYRAYPYDGKYILDDCRLIICQSNACSKDIRRVFPQAEINPLGDWKGGTNVDTGATNLSKADVSVNIYAWLKAQAAGKPVEISCAIGDGEVDGLPYSLIVALARDYISELGGFEKFAEWGLLRY